MSVKKGKQSYDPLNDRDSFANPGGGFRVSPSGSEHEASGSEDQQADA